MDFSGFNFSAGDILLAIGAGGAFVGQSIRYRERFAAFKSSAEKDLSENKSDIKDLRSRLDPIGRDLAALTSKIENVDRHVSSVSGKIDALVAARYQGPASAPSGAERRKSDEGLVCGVEVCRPECSVALRPRHARLRSAPGTRVAYGWEAFMHMVEPGGDPPDCGPGRLSLAALFGFWTLERKVRWWPELLTGWAALASCRHSRRYS